MSFRDATRAWELNCPPEHKLVLLWIAEASSSDGCNSWWKYNPHRLREMTGIQADVINRILGELMVKGILCYDEGESPLGNQAYYLLNIPPCADEPEHNTQRRFGPPMPAYSKKKINADLRRQVFERDAYRCQHCGGWENLCADHVIPESRGGPATFENLQTLCRSCNSIKGART